MGLVDRMIRASVDRAARMQPGRTQRVVDETLYSAPRAREEVAAIAWAARRLVDRGLSPTTFGSVAVRRSPKSVTVTRQAADLGSIDNRDLETVSIDDQGSSAIAGIRAGNDAAVWAFPPHLMAMSIAGLAMVETSVEVTSEIGPIRVVASLSDVGSGLTIVRGRGVVSAHDSPPQAVDRLELAETLAKMTMIVDRRSWSDHPTTIVQEDR